MFLENIRDVAFDDEEMKILENAITNLKKSAPKLSKIILDVEEQHDRHLEESDSLEGLKDSIILLLKKLYQTHQIFESNGITVVILGINLILEFDASQVTDAEVEE